MKKIIPLISLIILTSCNSVKKTQRALNSGNYIEAITTSVEKLRKNKFSNKSSEYAYLLKQSFEKYRRSILNQIEYLEKEQLKDNSKKIYELYLQLQTIQNKIKPLLPLENDKGEFIAFEFYDLSDNILAGKENYASYLYSKAVDLLTSGDKINSRLAYNNLVELEKLAPKFRDVSSLKRDAYLRGVDYVIVDVFNDTQQVIPEQLEDRLLNFNTFNLDNIWTEYHVNERDNVSYDFAVEIHFTTIEFSPERLFERQIPLEREVVDGWRYKKSRSEEYVLDDKGNKIKEDVIINANGILYESIQSKEVKVVADVNYFDLNSDQKINTFPLESIYVFENRFANFEGDSRILSKEEAFLLRQRFVDYPSNEQMLSDAAEEIKSKLKVIMKKQL